ncbi:hypothetical protein CHISP_1931 [Chitinispirillum alkaliphilum]|nr:hypothetical protein CHISP_1931 [Chitinispirillum alkaliphilum]
MILKKIVFLTAAIFLVYTSSVAGNRLTQEEALVNVTNCQTYVQHASVKHEHHGELLGLLNGSTWNVVSDEFEDFITEARSSQDYQKERIVLIGSRGHSLEHQVKNLKDSDCNPCLANNIRHFCRNAEALIAEVNSSLENLYQNVRENAGMFSSIFVQHAEEKLTYAIETSSADKLEDAQEKLKSAKAKIRNRNHSHALEIVFEIFTILKPELILD